MDVVEVVAAVWVALAVLVVLVVACAAHAGHLEDVHRGWDRSDAGPGQQPQQEGKRAA